MMEVVRAFAHNIQGKIQSYQDKNQNLLKISLKQNIDQMSFISFGSKVIRIDDNINSLNTEVLHVEFENNNQPFLNQLLNKFGVTEIDTCNDVK